MEPEGDWNAWVILGGRGAGKTRAGSEWVRAQVEGASPVDIGKARRVALVGATLDQVREVMVFGESGILACSPPDRRPHWNATRKCLEWENGAEAFALSAANPESFRGPQFDAAWLDEFAKWDKAEEAWDMLQFALRLGEHPRAVLTTTPRTSPILKRLLEDPTTAVSHGSTWSNAQNLSERFLTRVERDYLGTRRGREELEGLMLLEIEGALWSYEDLDRAMVEAAPTLDRIVIAVDPPASSSAKADECGVIVVGATYQGPPEDWRAYVLEDLSIGQARPHLWAQQVIMAYERYEADLIVAEVNQGGEMVESVLRQASLLAPVKSLRASKGKGGRAEPISALYEQGRVKHVGRFETLEEQMLQMSLTGYQGDGSPDRLDALVWALTEILVEPIRDYRRPRYRAL